MKIQDFKENDTVCILTLNTGRNTEPVIKESSVKTVGRKYVTLNDYAQSRYMEAEYGQEEYLVEDINYGERRLLFKSAEDARNHIRKLELAKWIGCMSVTLAEQYTLEQLEEVRKILNNDGK